MVLLYTQLGGYHVRRKFSIRPRLHVPFLEFLRRAVQHRVLFVHCHNLASFYVKKCEYGGNTLKCNQSILTSANEKYFLEVCDAVE